MAWQEPPRDGDYQPIGQSETQIASSLLVGDPLRRFSKRFQSRLAIEAIFLSGPATADRDRDSAGLARAVLRGSALPGGCFRHIRVCASPMTTRLPAVRIFAGRLSSHSGGHIPEYGLLRRSTRAGVVPPGPTAHASGAACAAGSRLDPPVPAPRAERRSRGRRGRIPCSPGRAR